MAIDYLLGAGICADVEALLAAGPATAPDLLVEALGEPLATKDRALARAAARHADVDVLVLGDEPAPA